MMAMQAYTAPVPVTAIPIAPLRMLLSFLFASRILYLIPFVCFSSAGQYNTNHTPQLAVGQPGSFPFPCFFVPLYFFPHHNHYQDTMSAGYGLMVSAIVSVAAKFVSFFTSFHLLYTELYCYLFGVLGLLAWFMPPYLFARTLKQAGIATFTKSFFLYFFFWVGAIITFILTGVRGWCVFFCVLRSVL
jgi:hypothetical protein